MPSKLRALLAGLRQTGQGLREAQGMRSRWRVLRLKLGGRLTAGARGAEATPLAVRMRGLGGRELSLRPGTSDLVMAVDDLRLGVHLPPAEIAGDTLRQVLELGSNVGSALADLAHRYPEATLVGVEPDPANAALARRNVAGFGARCRVLTAGIWDSETTLTVEGGEAIGFTVRPLRSADPASAPRIPALTIDGLLAEEMPEGVVDYIYMTIEGTEPRVLRAGGAWVERTRSIRLELHPYFGFRADDAISLLAALGFEATRHPSLPDKWVTATR